MSKIRYFSASVEASSQRCRDDVWAHVAEMVASAFPEARPLSVEAPWRYVYKMPEGSRGLGLWQGTVLLRDDGPTSHVAWSLVLYPEPAELVVAESELILAEMDRTLTELMHRLR